MRIRSLGALLLVLSPSIAAASADAIDAKDVSHRLFSKLQSLQASPPAAVARRGHLALLGSPYGLYASLHTAVTAVLHAIGNDQPLCLKAHRERHRHSAKWLYYPSKEFEAAHRCSSYNCYWNLTASINLYPMGCHKVWAAAVAKAALAKKRGLLQVRA